VFPRLLPSAIRRLWTTGLVTCCALLLTAGSGCGPDYKSRGVVKGKVTTGNKNLTSGTVMFYGKNGITASAPIGEDGTYLMPDAPLGECKVTVTVNALPFDPSVRARMKGGGPKMPQGPKDPNSSDGPTELPSGAKAPSTIVPIDAKYSNPDTSGLSFTVQKGENTYDIPL
jgi:hypothetical protein